MRSVAVVGLLGLSGLAGCANMCDRLFRARNVCRDQAATSVVAAPAVVAAPPQIVMDDTSTVMSPQVIVGGTDCGCVITGVSGYPGPVVMQAEERKGHPWLRPFRRGN